MVKTRVSLIPPNRELGRGYGKGSRKRGDHLHAVIVMRPTSRLPGRARRGILKVGGLTMPCAIGATGVTHGKREGDKATPAGSMRLLHGFFRADQTCRPRCAIPLRPITTDLAWCDAPGTPLYNRPATLPMVASHETLWRADRLYDIVIVLDYNLHPRRDGRGSAIFFHCAKPDLAPTLGCVALRPADMRRLLPRLGSHVRLLVPT